MIINGITCKVYGDIVTTIGMSLKKSTDSSGMPKWFDYGDQYDNTVIELIVTSEDTVGLEAIVREQSQVPNISVTFDEGEWLYTYASVFTIQSSSDYRISNRDAVEYGFKITLAPATPIIFTGLAGTRGEFCGNGMIYDGVNIPQPTDYKYQYNTPKATGITHGSSYSAEFATSQHDSNSFKVTMRDYTMRSILDKAYTTRGDAFFVTWADNSHPFGMARGPIIGQKIAKIQSDTIKITNSGDMFYTIDLSVTDISGVDVPTVIVQYGNGTNIIKQTGTSSILIVQNGVI